MFEYAIEVLKMYLDMNERESKRKGFTNAGLIDIKNKIKELQQAIKLLEKAGEGK